MRRLITCVVGLLAAVGLSACGTGRPIKYYTLELPPAPQPSGNPYPLTLLIGRITAPEILQDGPIAYRSGPNEIGVYNYHHWMEPPARMARLALIQQLRASGRYESVVELGSSVEGEFVLTGRLNNLEEVDGEAVSALVSMEFQLLDRKARKIVWTHFYSRSEPVQGKEIPDVVTTLDHNLDRGLTEVVSGLDVYFSSRFPGKS